MPPSQLVHDKKKNFKRKKNQKLVMLFLGGDSVF